MGIVDKAARRLEELRRSGIEVSHPGAAVAMAGSTASLPARAAEHFEQGRRSIPISRQGAELASVAPSLAPVGGANHSDTVQIDIKALNRMGFVSPDSPRSQIADEFRVIKRQLLANVEAEGAAVSSGSSNLIMVTSAVPDEGKTFVAINLAISLAMEMNKHVLLVDADVARPAVMRTLGVDRSAGFLDLLATPARDMWSVLVRTNIATLSLLPAGAQRPLATEMIASDAASRLLVEMARRYPDRIVIFDAPPLLPSTESRVLATHMGQVVLVVAAERTPQKAVMQALTTLEGCPVILPLLNKASYSEVGSYYGFYGPMER